MAGSSSIAGQSEALGGNLKKGGGLSELQRQKTRTDANGGLGGRGAALKAFTGGEGDAFAVAGTIMKGPSTIFCRTFGL